MKNRYYQFIRVFSLIWILCFNISLLQAQITKVKLYPYLVTNVSGLGNAGLMVDEQDLSGDPLNGTFGSPVTLWQSSYSAVYPISAIVDLGSEMLVTNIYIYDSYNYANLTFEYGNSENWYNLFTDPLMGYKTWNRHDVNVTTRYLRISKQSPNVGFNEIIVYADNPVLPPPPVTNLTPIEATPTTIKLSWTDVPGNQSTGSFVGYDLRYSKAPITEANFSTCPSFPVSFVPTANSNQQITITGLDNGTNYYFAIKLLGENSNSAISNFPSKETLVYYNQIESKLILKPELVVNELNFGVATRMVDEQASAGEPISGNGGTPATTWDPGHLPSIYPASAYIDLGSVVYISKIFLRDTHSYGDVIFSIGVPGNWTPIFTDHLYNYQKWNQHNVNAFARYVRVTLTTRQAVFSEIVVYTYSSGIVEQKIVPLMANMNNVSNDGDSWRLFDEQDIAGDPLNSPGGNPTTIWETSWSAYAVYPLFSELDLGKIFDVSHIFIRDSYDYSDFTIWSGSPGNWELLFTDNLTGYLSWNQHDVNSTTRYLRFGKSSPRSSVTEIVIYGFDNTPGEIDSIPPEKISDLVAQYNESGDIELTWTAPGDDGQDGTINYYEIRYYTDPVKESNFLACPKWASPPIPLVGGTQQSISIDGLLPDTKYYFAIKSIDDALNISELSINATIATQVVIGGEPYKFTLTPKMVINESVEGSAFFMVDEQSVSGDPKSGQTGKPITKWDLGSTIWMYPGYAIIDLGGNCLLSELYLYDMSDVGKDSTSPVSVYYGTPFNWNLLITDNLQGADVWKQHILNQEVRYLRVKIHSRETRVAEIIVYGTRLEMPVEEPEPQIHVLPTMDQLIGADVLVNDPIGRIQAVGFVREYHNWMWCDGTNNSSYPGYPNNKLEFNTLGWNFDYFYDFLKDVGVMACPDIQRNVPWLTNFNYSKLANKPVSPGEDPLLPASYAEHADHMFQYAARYGNAQVSPGLLKLATNQKVVSGANLINYYEDWNEHNQWWAGRDAFFTPYEYCAMASADCDGHMGTMGQTVGVKNADPNAKLVMSGLAESTIDYFKAMKIWSDYYRNGDLPVDVINVHHYCNNGPDIKTTGTAGISPESGDLKGLMAEFVDYRNRYYPDKEVWITEFGYDTHPESVLKAPQIGSFSQFEVQAQWLVRSYLLLAAAGVDRAAMYMMSDVNPNSSTKFDNSGLISSKATGCVPKLSWYYVFTMKNQLSGMHFDTEIQSENPDVMIYKFKNDNDSVSAYALWCPTSNQTSVPGFELNLGANDNQVKLVELVGGSIIGQETVLNVANGKVTVDVSERPVFVIVSKNNYEFPVVRQETKLVLSPSMVVNETGLGNAGSMVDEQELSGDPLMGIEGAPLTSWSPGWGVTYPRSSYIDLGQEYEVSKIYLRDLYAAGNMTVSVGTPGNWTPVFDDDLGRYGVWSGHVVDKTTRYVRITLHDVQSCFSELIMYVRE